MPPGLKSQIIYFDEGRPDGLLKEQATGQLRVAEWVWRRIDEGEDIKVIPVVKYGQDERSPIGGVFVDATKH